MLTPLVSCPFRLFLKGRRNGRLSVSIGMRRWRSSAGTASRSWTTSEFSFVKPGPALTTLHQNRFDPVKRQLYY